MLVRARKFSLFFLLIIILFGIFAPLTFFEGDKILIGLDEWTPLRPGFRLYDWFYTWGHQAALGKDVSSRVVTLPTQVLPFALLEKLGFSLVISQKVFYVVIFLLAGLSMYYLALTLWEKEYLVAFIASIFYMFNPVMGGYWASFLVPAIFCIAVSPLLLAFFIRGLKSQSYVRYAVVFALSTLLYPAASPPLYLILGMVFIIFLVYFFVQAKDKKTIIKFTLLSAFLFLVINSWWWLNLARTYLIVPDLVESQASYGRLMMNSLKSSFHNLFRFQTNYWGYSYWGDQVNNWVGFLYATNPLLIIISFIYALIAFSSLLLAKKNRLIIVLCFFSLIFIFLSKGVHLPFGSVYKQFYRLPLFNSIRTPAHKFPTATALLFSLLIGWVTNEFFRRLQSKTKLMAKGLLLLIIFLIIGGQWYFFTGDAVQRGKSAQPPILTKFPNYYWEAADWLSTQKDFFRIFTLPGSDISTLWLTYKWGFLGLYSVPSDVFQRPIIDKLPLNSYDTFRWGIYALLGNYSDLPYPFLKLPPSDSLYKLLNLMNVKYVLINNDVDWQHMHYGTENPKLLAGELGKQKNIFYEKSFDNLDFYRVEGNYQLPQIYASTQPGVIYGDDLSLHVLSSFSDWQSGAGIYLNQKNSLVNQIYILADLLNPIQQVELARENAEQTINFPYVRWSPKSRFYKIVAFREKRQENKIVDPKEKLMTKLHYAGKRISELEKWGKELSDEKWQEMLKNYEEKMYEALAVLAGFKQGNDFYSLLIEIKVYLSAYENKLQSIIQNDSGFRQDATLDVLDNITDEFQKEIDRNRLKELLYEMEVLEDGDYEIFIRNENFLSFTKSPSIVRLKLEGNQTEFAKDIAGNNKDWLLIGRRKLKAGKNRFSLGLSEPLNLINENGWKKLAKVRFLEKFVGKDEASSFLFQKIKKFQPNALYKISFDYQFEGSTAGLVLAEESIPLFTKKLRCGGKRQRHFETIFRSGIKAKSAGVYFFFSFPKESENIILKNVVVERLFEPVVLFHFLETSSKFGATPAVTYTKINSTKYQAEAKDVKNPYVLIFSETFSPDWKVTINGKKLSEDRHLLINGYANSWLIEPTDAGGKESYEIVLEYKPQRFFYLGLLISSLGFLGCFGYLFFKLLKR